MLIHSFFTMTCTFNYQWHMQDTHSIPLKRPCQSKLHHCALQVFVVFPVARIFFTSTDCEQCPLPALRRCRAQHPLSHCYLCRGDSQWTLIPGSDGWVTPILVQVCAPKRHSLLLPENSGNATGLVEITVSRILGAKRCFPIFVGRVVETINASNYLSVSHESAN